MVPTMPVRERWRLAFLDSVQRRQWLRAEPREIARCSSREEGGDMACQIIGSRHEEPMVLGDCFGRGWRSHG